MRLLKSIFNFQLKKAVKKRNVLVFIVIAVILQIFLQVGKSNYTDIQITDNMDLLASG